MRKVKDVPAEQLKKTESPVIAEPTIESRLSGLEYRIAHPNTPNLEAILDDDSNRETFAEAFDDRARDRRVVFRRDLEANCPARAVAADTSAFAKRFAFRNWLFILALILLSNGVFLYAGLSRLARRPAPAPTGSIYIGGNELLGGNELPVTDSSVPISSHLEIDLEKTCWVAVHDDDGGDLIEGELMAPGYDARGNWKSVTVRSGCPGFIHYKWNGVPQYPANRSRKPELSEVVTLP